LPPELNELGGHRPLRGAPKDEHGFCLGSAGSSSIKRNLELGHSLRTAVVEVQLYDCRDADTARAIAVALREACAIELGIEPDEMGFAATPALTPDRTESWCAVVYDRASGGAGFASTVAEEPIRCLKAARELLDCSAPGGCGEPGAERFCSRCLLSADTQHMIERCNRLTAFQVLDELIPRLEIAAEDRLFGVNTELESAPLADALTRRVAQAPSRTIVLWLHGAPQDWEFDEWPARALAETWGPRGVPIRFVARADAIRAADITTRHSLARLVQRSHIAELVEWVDGVVAATPLAAHLGDTSSLVWASRDGLAGEPAAEWGRSSTAPVVRGSVDGPTFGKTIDISALLSPSPETAVVEVSNDADGAAVGFGLRLRRALETQSGDLLQRAGDGKLVEVIYTDRYVFSPLSALLAAELVGAFIRRSEAKIIVRTRGTSKSLHASPPWQVQHDWTTQSDRLAVLRKLLTRSSDEVRVNFDDTTPHRRTLVLKWEGAVLELTLDQGVGPWQPADRCRFDFGKSPDEQAQALLKAPLKVTNAASSTFVVIRRL
jgi:DEAD/DEAH box helicase domain-containing protein